MAWSWVIPEAVPRSAIDAPRAVRSRPRWWWEDWRVEDSTVGPHSGLAA